MFAALSRIGTVCSRSEGLAPALHECAEILATLYPHATVTPLLANAAGEDAADVESAPADNDLDPSAALDWTEHQHAAGGLADGGGWWQRDSAAWRDAGLDELAAANTRDVGVACAVHGQHVHGVLLMQTRTPLPTDAAMGETMRTVSLHLSLLAARLHLTAALRASHAELEQQARMDPLTGLANRRQLEDETARLAARTRRHGGQACAVFIDLDDFKRINDDHGHDAGDRFLIEIARRLMGVTRTEEICGRYGGDEFVALTHLDSAAESGADALRARLEAALHGRFELDSLVLDYPGPSIGVAVQTSPDESVEDLLTRADEAMYKERMARRAGRGE